MEGVGGEAGEQAEEEEKTVVEAEEAPPRVVETNINNFTDDEMKDISM